jgi:aspartate/methionine/tyrosine aminotransferase
LPENSKLQGVDTMSEPGATYFGAKKLLAELKRASGLILADDGSHRRPQPYEEVSKAGAHSFTEQSNLLGYISSITKNNSISLAHFFDVICPPAHTLDLRDAYHELYVWFNNERSKQGFANEFLKSSGDQEISFEKFLEIFAETKVSFTKYRETFSEMEGKAIMAAYFRATGIKSSIDTVLVGSRGAKGEISDCLSALAERKPGSVLLIEKGHYHTLSLLAENQGYTLELVDKLDGEAVRRAYEKHGTNLKAIYVSTVSNPYGRVHTKGDMEKIASSVRDINGNKTKDAMPLTVISDEVYLRSNLDDAGPISFAALEGMSDCTVTVTSPAKTFAFADTGFGASTTSNAALSSDMKKIRMSVGFKPCNQATTVAALAAFALTPVEWIESNNQEIARRLEQAEERIGKINEQAGEEIVGFERPQGGWYITIELKGAAKELLPRSTDAVTYLARYGRALAGSEGVRAPPEKTGIICYPGILFGLERKENTSDTIPVAVRATLALGDSDNLDEFFKRLGAAMITLIKISVPKLNEILEPAQRFKGGQLNNN